MRASPDGVIYSVAQDTSLLAFRLSRVDAALALEMGAKEKAALGANWLAFDAWSPNLPTRQWMGDLRYWCERSYRHTRESGALMRQSTIGK